MKKQKELKCPKCDGALIGVEYSHDSKFHYDGVSEWVCANYHADGLDHCDYRVGRWCEMPLGPGEVEKQYCDGKGHPRIFTIND